MFIKFIKPCISALFSYSLLHTMWKALSPLFPLFELCGYSKELHVQFMKSTVIIHTHTHTINDMQIFFLMVCLGSANFWSIKMQFSHGFAWSYSHIYVKRDHVRSMKLYVKSLCLSLSCLWEEFITYIIIIPTLKLSGPQNFAHHHIFNCFLVFHILYRI